MRSQFVSLDNNSVGTVIGKLANDNNNSWTLAVTVDRNDFLSLDSSTAEENRTKTINYPLVIFSDCDRKN